MKSNNRTIEQSNNFSRGFTLIEMLIVLGIIGILSGIGIATYSGVTRRAQKARCQELVSDVATALEGIYQKDGCWPRRILAGSNSDQGLTKEVAYDIAKKKMMALSIDPNNSEKHETVGADRMGIVSPWAAAVIKRAGKKSVSDGTKIPSGGTIRDHRLRYAVDEDGKGYVKANVGGETLTIRGAAAVWCCGADGKLESYSVGQRKDDVYSWNKGQIKQ